MIMRVKSNNYALYNAVTYNPSSITSQGYNNYINNGEKREEEKEEKNGFESLPLNVVPFFFIAQISVHL